MPWRRQTARQFFGAMFLTLILLGGVFGALLVEESYRRVLQLLGSLAYLHHMDTLSLLAAPGDTPLLEALEALEAQWVEALPGGMERFALILED